MADNRKATFIPEESRSNNTKYTRITDDMTESKAWAELDAYDITAYLYFKKKYYVVKKGKNKGKSNAKNISLTYAEMRGVMSSDRFKKSIDKLLAVGLIDLIQHRPQARECTIYGLSRRWHNYGTEQFKPQQRPTLARRRGG